MESEPSSRISRSFARLRPVVAFVVARHTLSLADHERRRLIALEQRMVRARLRCAKVSKPCATCSKQRVRMHKACFASSRALAGRKPIEEELVVAHAGFGEKAPHRVGEELIGIRVEGLHAEPREQAAAAGARKVLHEAGRGVAQGWWRRDRRERRSQTLQVVPHRSRLAVESVEADLVELGSQKPGS